MSNKVFEEKGGPHRGHAAGETDLEKQASQLASDTKYKVKQRMGASVTRMSPAAVTKAYLAQLMKSPAPAAVKTLAQKKILGVGLKEEYGIDELVSSTVANAMYKVFVDGAKTVAEENNSEERFLIVVTDKKTGNEYRRKATREKIAELRANPNIARVEITQYGQPYDKEAKSGEQTAAVKSGKGLAKRDYDDDGKVESSAKEHAGAVHNAIQRRKGLPANGKDTTGIKEELVGGQKKIDVAAPYGKLTGADFKELRKTRKKVMESFFEQKVATKDQNDAEIVSNEEKGVDNKKIIKVFPELGVKESALGKFHELIQERKMTKAEKAKEEKIGKKTKKKALPAMKAEYGDKKGEQIYYAWKRKQAMRENADCDYETTPKLKKTEEPVDDARQMKTKVNLVKNKLRSMGLKMSYEPEGEQIDEIAPLIAGGLALGGAALAGMAIKRSQDAAKSGVDAANKGKEIKNPGTGIAGAAYGMQRHNNALKDAMKQLNHYEPNGKVISERENDEPGERDDRPDVKAHNRAVGYRPRPRRPRMEDDPRYGTPRDRSGNWKY
jgi:hypothetical protein